MQKRSIYRSHFKVQFFPDKQRWVCAFFGILTAVIPSERVNTYN